MTKKEEQEKFIYDLIKLKNNKGDLAKLRSVLYKDKNNFSYSEILYKIMPVIHNEWEKSCFIAVASLFGYNSNHTEEIIDFGCALGKKFGNKITKSTKESFISLLNTRNNLLFYKLCNFVKRLEKEPINYKLLLSDLILWNSINNKFRKKQNQWAEHFFKYINLEEGEQEL